MCRATRIIWVVPSTQLPQSFSQGITRPLARETHHLCRILVPTSLGTQEFKAAVKHWPLLIKTNSMERSHFPNNSSHEHTMNDRLLYKWPVNRDFLTAINYWLPGKKFFRIPDVLKECNLPNPLLYKTKPKSFLSMIWIKHHGTISDKLSQLRDHLKMLVSYHLQIAYTS